MRKFLVPGLKSGATTELPEKEARHAVLSLRLKAGDKILLLDGKGKSAEAEILSTENNSVSLKVGAVQELPPRPQVILLQAQLKGAKMDWLIEKLTELGVSSIRVMHTKHTVAQSEKIDRWLRLSEAAAKQSGNSALPEISPPASFQETLAWAKSQDARKIHLDPKATQSLAALVQPNKALLLAIGPEGGFSPEEEQALEDAGFLGARLSENVLRGETAAITASAIALHLIAF